MNYLCGMKLRRYLQAIIFTTIILFQFNLSGQNIIIDEEFSDWQNVTSYDDKDDTSGLDIESLAVAHDNENIYLKLKFDREFSLQENNNINLTIESTDFTLDFNFGEREGRITQSGFDPKVYHNDIGLISSPTVTSDEFEILIKRDWQNQFVSNTLVGDLNIHLQNGNGDRIPDTGHINYFLTDQIPFEFPNYKIGKSVDTDFRLCSYNVLRDGIFDSDTRAAYTGILRLINPDIIAFQEIYDHTDIQTLSRVLNVFNALDTSSPWHSSKRGADIILLSKFPITYSREVGGNGVFVVDKDGQDMMIINVHFPCCENDNDREREINSILSFIKDAKEGNANYNLESGTPIIITGDTNFVGNADQVEAIKNGLFFSNNNSTVTLDWDNSGLADSKPITTGFNSAYTWFSSFSSYFAGRLDYIFYSDSNLEAINSFVLDTKGLTLNELQENNLKSFYTETASDHLPVVTDFKLLNTDATTELDPSPFLLYPNPASTNITFNLQVNDAWVEILDYSGKLVETTTSNSLNISHLPSGPYLALFKNSRGKIIRNQKFVISH